MEPNSTRIIEVFGYVCIFNGICTTIKPRISQGEHWVRICEGPWTSSHIYMQIYHKYVLLCTLTISFSTFWLILGTFCCLVCSRKEIGGILLSVTFSYHPYRKSIRCVWLCGCFTHCPLSSRPKHYWPDGTAFRHSLLLLLQLLPMVPQDGSYPITRTAGVSIWTYTGRRKKHLRI